MGPSGTRSSLGPLPQPGGRLHLLHQMPLPFKGPLRVTLHLFSCISGPWFFSVSGLRAFVMFESSC